MRIQGEGQLLRIFIGESDRWEGKPLYEAIVRAAREHGLSGATVLRGLEGFGANSVIHSETAMRLSKDLPIIVEIVDLPERLGHFLPTLDKMVGEGMVTQEKVNVLIYRHNSQAEAAADDEELELDTDQYKSVAERASPLAHATDSVRQILARAKEEAAESRHVFIDSVHVLLAIIDEARQLVDNVFAELDMETDAIEEILRSEVTREPQSNEYLGALGEKCRSEANWLSHQEIGTGHLLLALCETRPSAATDILTRQGVQPREVCRVVLRILGHADDWQRWLADHPDM